jgi:uncharacterized DUF497 family protein
VRFEWDEGKNQVNLQKHGITFEFAALVFDDPNCLITLDRIDDGTGELRWAAIGQAEAGSNIVVLVVGHVYREDNNNGEEIIRIVSARKASKNDIRRYQPQEAD